MSHYIPVEPNVKLYVEDLNPEGKPILVFLHGWPGSHELFEYQLDVLPALGFRCIGIDQRGFGKSDRPFHGYDYDRLSDDVRCVMEALQLEHVTLIGHSTGGAIAIRYMARHKGFGVSRLVLCAAAAPSLIMRPDFPYGLPEQSVLDMIRNTYEDRPKMLMNFGDSFFYQYITEAFSRWFFSLGLQAAGWSTVAVEKTWINEVLFEDMKCIRVPTLILHGIHDKIILPPLGEIQQKLIRNSKLVLFRYSGHGLFYDEKEKFNEELCHFAGRG